MRFLRTAPTRRLLALIAGVVASVVGCTAIAVAATSGGPVPQPEPLAKAVHDALAAPQVAGFSAQVTYTNNLIASSDIQGSDPLLTGASGRLWIAPHYLRLELQSNNGDAQVVADNGNFWIYDPSSNTVYQGSLPSSSGGSGSSSSSSSGSTTDQIPTVAQIQDTIDKLAAHLTGLTAVPTDVGGQAAYSVTVSPKDTSGLIGSVQLAWDAYHGVPLSFSVYAKGDPNAVLSLQASDVSYGPVPLSTFQISPPSGANKVTLSSGTPSTGTSGSTAPDTTPLTFTPAAPATAGGMPLTASHRAGADGELLSYGTGLGSVQVLERAGSNAGPAMPGSGSGSGSGSSGNSPLTLPTVSVNGATASELSTELGTVLEYKAGGVDYLVFGSVPASTAIAVARDL